LKLTELDPRKLTRNDELLGLAFLCPCCRKEYLTFFLQPTSYKDQKSLVEAEIGNGLWVPCAADYNWSAANEDDLSRITVRPSIGIDGHWRGVITDGKCS